MNSWFRRFLYFSRQQQIAILLLLIIILLIIAFGTLHHNFYKPKQSAVDSTFVKQALLFRDTLRTYTPYHPKSYPKTYAHDIQIVLRPFDPNTADSLTLLSVGFKPYMIKNLMKYRAKGGLFRNADQLKNLYGMTSELHQTLRPYIEIDSTRFINPNALNQAAPLIAIELNSADTAALKQLRGIGDYLSVQIVLYRHKLGGYYSISQLTEIPGITPELLATLAPQLSVNPDSIKPVMVNKSSIEGLKRHPYINFYQAKAIYEKKRELRFITCIEQLQSLPEFNDSTLQRLAPYLNFDIPDYAKK